MAVWRPDSPIELPKGVWYVANTVRQFVATVSATTPSWMKTPIKIPTKTYSWTVTMETLKAQRLRCSQNSYHRDRLHIMVRQSHKPLQLKLALLNGNLGYILSELKTTRTNHPA